MTKVDIKHRSPPLELLNSDRKKLHGILVEIISLTGFVYGENRTDVNISDAQELAHILDLLEVPLVRLKKLSEDKKWAE